MRNFLLYSGALLPIILFFGTVCLFSVNIPFYDDFDSVLAFIYDFDTAGGLTKKLQLIFSQHNEHRIVFNKIFTIISYYIAGEINFKLFIFFGNLALAGIAIVCFLSFKQDKNKLLYFIPVLFFLFQFQSYENIFWGMASIQNFYVLLFALLSLYFINRESSYSFGTAVVFAIVATFTSGNGMFCFIIGLAVLLFHKKYQYATWWAMLMIIAMLAYFYTYSKPAHHPSIYESVFTNPLTTMGYFFIFISSLFVNTLLVNIILGIALIVFLVILFLKGYHKKNPTIFSFLLFLLLTASAVSLSRSGFGLGQALAPRYAINSTLIFMSAYIAFVEMVKDNKYFNYVYIALLCFSVIFNIHVFLRKLKTIQNNRMNSIYAICGGVTFDRIYPDSKAGKFMLDRAVKNNYYYPPEYLSLDNPKIVVKESKLVPTAYLTFSFDIKDVGKYITIKNGWAFLKGSNGKKNKVYFALIRDQKTYLIETIEEIVPAPVEGDTTNLNPDRSVFSVSVTKGRFEKGNYKTGVYIKKQDNSEYFQYSGVDLQIP